MANRVTIQDIADALDLSRNTVSKVLNNSEGPADATRERVLQKALEMGYKHFDYASMMQQLKSEGASDGHAGVLGDKPEVALLSTAYLAAPHFSSLMLDAVQSNLSRLGYTLNAHRVSAEDLADRTLPRTFDVDRVAAIICVEMFDYDYDLMVCELGIPTLFVDGPAQLNGRTLPSDMLLMENTTQVMKLVHDMVGRGITKIGFIGNWEHCQSFYERYNAFRIAMLEAGLPIDQRFCMCENAVEETSVRLAALDELPELFICANDFVALDTLSVFHKLGIDVPRDILLAGFDDSAESRRSLPQLTTIHIHTQVMAFAAVQMLRTRVKEPSHDYLTMHTETDLIYRASTDLP